MDIKKLLSLPEDVQSAIKNRNISLGHAKVLLSVENPQDYLETVIEKQLSVRQLEKWIEKGDLSDSTENDKTKSGSSIEEESEDVANITFDMIKQLYSPILQNTNDGDNVIDTKRLKRRISNQTDAEWQSVQNNIKIIEDQLKDSCGFNIKLLLNRTGSGKVEISFANADDLLEIVKLFQQ